MYLFFDTETTGVKNSPRIVQIAWVLTDENGNELRTQSFIVRPDGFEIPASATAIHGITTEVARRSGIEIATVLEAFAKDIVAADFLVAHNVRFDNDIVCDEYRRIGQNESPLIGKNLFCTMQSSTDFCKIKNRGRSNYKWPTLDELHISLFGATFESAHDALADTRACVKCFFELKRRGIISGTEMPVRNKVPFHEYNEDDEYEDENLFEEIDALSDSLRDSEARFVDSVHRFLRARGFITDNQRNALKNILFKLEDR